MSTLKRAISKMVNFCMGKKITIRDHNYDGPYKEPERTYSFAKKFKRRGHDYTMRS